MGLENTGLVLSTASKTFVVGEYLALAGGPAVLVNTEPRFELHVRPGNGVEGIHPDSPAGVFIAKNRKIFSGRRLSFVDPHEGRGGFGASSAQFALCYTLSDFAPTMDEIMKHYLDCAWNGEGHAPSGADVIAQLLGSDVTFVDKKNETLKTTSWPFADLKFALARTGEKVPTHEHLQNLELREIEPFRLPVRMVWQGLVEKNSQMFLDGLERFSARLEQKNWVADSTRDLMKRLSFVDAIRSMKGCGALGADVLFIAYESDEEALPALQSLGLEVVATSDQLSPGFNTKSIAIDRRMEL